MTYGIIGAGRVGCALAGALSHSGKPPAGIFSRNHKNAVELKQLLHIDSDIVYDDVQLLIQTVDCLFVCLPDSAISSFSDNIAASMSHEMLCGKMIFHMSGALDSTELNAFAKKGACVASLHPLQAFSDKKDGWILMQHIYFGFEGDEKCQMAAQDIVRALDGHMLYIPTEKKAIYHAAACMLSNYTVTLAYVAEKMIREAVSDGDAGIKALLPLLQGTVANIGGQGAVDALTGPVSRGDVMTVQKHLKAIARMQPQSQRQLRQQDALTENEETLEIYRVLARETVEIARMRVSSDDDEKSLSFDRIEKLLEK